MRSETIKVIFYVEAIIFFVGMMVVCKIDASIRLREANKTVFEKDAVVDEIDIENDLIVFVTDDGNCWDFEMKNPQELYSEGQKVVLTFDLCSSEEVEDDIIIDIN